MSVIDPKQTSAAQCLCRGFVIVEAGEVEDMLGAQMVAEARIAAADMGLRRLPLFLTRHGL